MRTHRSYDADLRIDLVRAAARAVAAGGEAAVSLRSVAAEAGTTTAGVYALFGSRDGLIDAVVEAARESFQDRMQSRTIHEDLYEVCRSYRAAVLAAPNDYRAMSREPARRRDVRLSLEHGVVNVSAAVRRLLGPAASPRETAEHLVTVIALVHGLVMLEIDSVLDGSEDERAEAFRRSLEQLVLPIHRSRSQT